MNWTREQLKNNAKLMVRKNWLACAIVSFVIVLCAGGSNGSGYTIDYSDSGSGVSRFANGLMQQFGGSWAGWFLALGVSITVVVVLLILSILIKVFIGNILRVGGTRFYLHNIHSEGSGSLDDLLFAFRNHWTSVAFVMFMRDLFTFLWTLLLVVPGIIKTYEYRLVPYLLADNPELDYHTALRTSSAMMDGEKMNAFILDLSFLLWNIASAMTFGILGLVWVNPYVDATSAELYTAINTRWSASHTGGTYYVGG